MGGLTTCSDSEPNVPIQTLERFVSNPIQISSKDELFDLLDLNRGQPIKYFVTTSTAKYNFERRRKIFRLNQQLFRKFFYDSSAFLEPEVVFAELTNPSIAKEVFGEDSDSVMCI